MDKFYGMYDSPVDERDIIYGNMRFHGRSSKLPRKFRVQETPVRNQGWLGSCLGMATAACVEQDAMVRYDRNVGHLSPLFVYSYAKTLDGIKDQGTTGRAIMDALKRYGVCEEKLYPYIDDMDTRKNVFPPKSSEAIENAKLYKSNGYARITDLDEIKDAVYYENGCIICVAIFSNMEDTYRGFIKPPKGHKNGNHAMTVVGYDDDLEQVIDGINYKGFLILKDSYGDSKGRHEGHFYLAYEGLRWKVVYDSDKLFRECWTSFNPSSVANMNYHLDRFDGVAIRPKQKVVKMKIGSKVATIDGVQKSLTSEPVVMNGTTLVPIRFISESFDCRVYYEVDHDGGKRVSIYEDNLKLKIDMWVGNTVAKVNGEVYKMVQSPTIVNGSTLIPIRAVSEMLGYRVDFNSGTKEITIIG